jgi:glucose-1-phosphate adenylyltransferase
MRSRIISIVLGGGRGTRLYPLTQHRCKPAVPLAGKYRLVDIPISNCLNSGLNEIYVLTQFNTASLHRHIQASYAFDPFGGGLVDILSAEQTEKGDNWYQGTADAVRQNIIHFRAKRNDLILILSGDQLYRMDFRKLIEHHRSHGADATIAATPIAESEVSGFGLMKVRDDFSVDSFVEKPTDPAVIESYRISDTLLKSIGRESGDNACLASMGIYLFNASVLIDALDSEHTDFGKEVIPGLLGKKKLNGYIFDGYWEDIGTVAAFFEANLKLTDEKPPFDFFDPHDRIFTRARFLPASVVINSRVDRAMVADGCVIKGADIKRSVIGVRSMIGENVKFSNVVMMGNDSYEDEEVIAEAKRNGIPNMGVGSGCVIRQAIIDKNARIGTNVTLDPEGKAEGNYEHGITVRDGILMVAKDAVVPSGYCF